MRRQITSVIWALTVVLAAAVSVAAADVPKKVGPQGFLLWEKPRAVPELSFATGDGRSLTLADFHGKVVLLNIWATWCGPCREEMPTLDALQAELGSSAFEVLALSIDRAGIGAVKEFYQEIGIRHLNQYIDQTATAAPKLSVVGIPTTLLLDRQGRELGRLVGSIEWDSPEMVTFIREMIETTKESDR
jgi:thiol-disulfide isomerase/thioredoxin